MTSASGTPASLLALADWRRQMAALYGEVRRLAESDPAAAHGHWRRVRERLYREHPQSPISPPHRPAFVAQYYAYDPALRFELPLRADGASRQVEDPLPMSRGPDGASEMHFSRMGWIALPLPGGARRLAVFWMESYTGGLFLPFRDATNGTETYGAGRYLLDGGKGADLGSDAAQGTVVVDFNFAYHPSCAFDPAWLCPLAPTENWLDIPIRAGERLQ